MSEWRTETGKGSPHKCSQSNEVGHINRLCIVGETQTGFSTGPEDTCYLARILKANSEQASVCMREPYQ